MAWLPALDVLRQFFVINPEYGAKDGEEHKKLLFYHPKFDSLDVQVQNVGFCEAVVKFSETFTGGDAPFHEVDTEKQLHVYCSVEEKFLVGASFDKAASKDRPYFLHGKALYNVVVRAYETFRLFFGTFDRVIKKSDGVGGVASLKERLDYFFTRYLTSLKLASIPLLDALEWVAYMKLDPTNYLKAQTFVDRTLEMFPCVRRYVLLHNDRLLLHNLSMSNLPCLCRYLVQNLLPISLSSELQPEYGVRTESTSTSSSHGKFITGPTSSSSSSTASNVKLPSVFLIRDDECGEPNDRTGVVRLDEYYLVVYRALNATLAMLVSVGEASSMGADFFRNLDAAIGLHLTNLASSFVDLVGLDESGFSSHQYIYYNSVNLALTTTLLNQPPSKSSNSSTAQGIPLELAGVLCDFRDKITESDYFGDLLAKAEGDHWVAAKKAGDRELYTVIHQKNATLTDAHEETKRFCNAIFENVFLSE